MKKHIIKCLIVLILGTSLNSCVRFDILPQNMVGDETAFNSQAGVTAYFAAIYRDLRMEDFNYTIYYGFNNEHGWQYRPSGGLTGEIVSRDIHNCEYEPGNVVWEAAYKNIRRINYFIQNFSKYEDNFDAASVKHLYGEAYFLRAYEYFALAKRYGGVPYLTGVVDYPDCGFEGTYVYRNSEEETWTMIGEDLDMAYEMMAENAPCRGRASRYTAIALKSTAMLFAGSVAKYNDINHFDPQTKKQVCGIPSEKAKDFFRHAYDAAKLVEGHASLYKKHWAAGNKDAMVENFVRLFLDTDNPEILLSKEYSVPDMGHSWDKFMLNRMYVVDGIGSSGTPTLELVEMFDGIPKDENGHFKCFDENSNYILYDERTDPWVNAEPRLRATVLTPGEVWSGTPIDIRRGIYVGPWEHGITQLLENPESGTNYKSTSHKDGDGMIVDASTDEGSQSKPYEFSDGTKMTRCGLAGPFSENAEGAHTGFSIRKFLDPDFPASSAYEMKCKQQWIDLRYAEVMLNRAEAAYELFLEGDSEGASLIDDAAIQINMIRERGGADLLVGSADLNIDVIRRERRKELAFESKVYWDLRRWRILHIEQNATVYHTLMPFYVPTTNSAEGGKWFYDRRQDMYQKTFTYDTRRYYSPLETAELNRNPNLCQNQGY